MVGAMKYPHVMDEETTLRCALSGMSIARYGDGELRLANGGDSVSQRERTPELRSELVRILSNAQWHTPGGGNTCLVCIPRVDCPTPKSANWARYTGQQYVKLYKRTEGYGSAFITRPDSAPWIDKPEYWDDVSRLWEGKNVCLVRGDDKSLTPGMMHSAASVRDIIAPRQNAYSQIDKIEAEIGATPETVILCLGATATCLAYRLAMKGIHALDLGHMGMFMKHAGAYRYKQTDLISDKYLKLNKQLHSETSGFGDSGYKEAERVRDYAIRKDCESILDYGCGEGTLKIEMVKELKWSGPIFEYDPAVKGKEALPKPADFTACTDVLEHVEPALIGNVLQHVRGVTRKACYMTIATRLANKILPNGENAHLTVQGAAWWMDRVMDAGWSIEKYEDVKKGSGEPHVLRLWLVPR